jgi:hypothetical protein
MVVGGKRIEGRVNVREGKEFLPKLNCITLGA